jgi:hypothetical protein
MILRNNLLTAFRKENLNATEGLLKTIKIIFFAIARKTQG